MQYVPSYYGYPNGNQQQPVASQALHMTPPHHHQAYTQPTQQQGIPTYPMGLPQTQSPHHQQQHHPVLSQSATNDFNMLTKPKRKQVKNACVNCQKACKKCDDGRPCQRCIKYGLTETCTNSVRKERKKGVKRGPYKRRNQANAESSNSSAGGAIRGQTNNHTNANVNTNNTNLNTTTMSSPYGNYPSYESYPSTNPNVTYTNPMQQYVLAIQQQQALYNNLPYQQPMNTSSTPSTPLATTPTPTTVPSPLPHSTTTTPNTNNTNTNNNSNNNNPNDHHSPSSITHEQKDTTHHHHLQQQSSSSSSNNESSQKLKMENDEEGSKKLNVLSQLCSDVLDRSPEQKPAIINHNNNNNNNMETNTNMNNNNNNNNIQRPILSTPISSTPSSANASPILYKQEIQNMVYPNHHQQQHQQQPHHLSQNNWQPHW